MRVAWNKGLKWSDEVKSKISESAKGRTPWNKGTKGVQVAWNKGLTFSDESKKRMSESHKGQIAWNKGLKWSEESKRKMSQSHRGQIAWNRGLKWSAESKGKMSRSHEGQNAWNKGKTGTISESGRSKLSIAIKQRWENNRDEIIEAQNQGKLQSDLFKQSSRKNAQKTIRAIWNDPVRKAKQLEAWKLANKKHNTKIELMLQEELASRNIPFLSQVVIEGITIVDIRLVDSKTVVFADGCYWHSCPKHNAGNYLIRGTTASWLVRAKDIQITQALESKGWIVYRFWEHEIKTSVKDCVDKILKSEIQTANATLTRSTGN